MFFNDAFISPHIEKKDLIFRECDGLFNDKTDTFDFIVTNPPWGSKLSREQKDFLLQSYPALNTTEVYSIALFNAVKMLSDKGQLNFFLPESILNVGAHKNIRKFLLESGRNIEITPLGKAFKGVQSECIFLRLSEKKYDNVQIVVKNDSDVVLDKKNIVNNTSSDNSV